MKHNKEICKKYQKITECGLDMTPRNDKHGKTTALIE